MTTFYHFDELGRFTGSSLKKGIRSTSVQPPSTNPSSGKIWAFVEAYGQWMECNEPVVEVVSPAPKAPMTKLEVMSKLTQTELVTIYTAAKSNVAIEVWLDMFKLAESIDPNDSRTIQGFAMLEGAGLLDPGRAAEILG